MYHILIGFLFILVFVLLWFILDKIKDVDERVDGLLHHVTILTNRVIEVEGDIRGLHSVASGHRRELDKHIVDLKNQLEHAELLRIEVEGLKKDRMKEISEQVEYNNSYGDPEIIDFMDNVYRMKEGKGNE